MYVCEPAPELSETLAQYTTIIVLKFLTTTPNVPGLPLVSNTKENPEKQLKHIEPWVKTHTAFIVA